MTKSILPGGSSSWIIVAAAFGIGSILKQNDLLEITPTIDPAMMDCVVELDPDVGIKQAFVRNSDNNPVYFFTQGTDAFGSKWTGEGMIKTGFNGSALLPTSVGAFQVHMQGGKPVACEVAGEIYQAQEQPPVPTL